MLSNVLARGAIFASGALQHQNSQIKCYLLRHDFACEQPFQSLGRICIGRIILTQTNFPFICPGIHGGNDSSSSMISSLQFPSSPVNSILTILPSVVMIQVSRVNSSGRHGFLNCKCFIKYLIKSSCPLPNTGMWSTMVYTESQELC